MNGFDLSTISDCYIGSAQASAIYLSSTKIWPTHDYSQDYFTIVPHNTAYVCYNNCNAYDSLGSQIPGYYSLDDGVTWNAFPGYTENWAQNTSVQVQANQKILIKHDILHAASMIGRGIHVTQPYHVEGNILSLSVGDNFASYVPGSSDIHWYVSTFAGETNLISASNLIFPTNVWTDCGSMFFGCASLIDAPKLPNTKLSQDCYSQMFMSCTLLTVAPMLPATTLTSGCYRSMFYGCTSLTTAPALPATTLASECYMQMFYGCTSLTTAPDLSAIILTTECYRRMFYGCSSLNYIKCLATNISATNCTYYWTWNVGASGTFVKDANTTWTTGADGIPSGWAVQNA